MAGFFSELQIASKAPQARLPACGACGLFKQCQSPKMPIDGEGRKKILIVGEAPGKNEDQEGQPFVGKSGRLLRDTLDDLGVNMRKDCWITNALICRPPGNRTPTDKEIGYCRPNINLAIDDLKPNVIITLGKAAVTSVIEPLWKENVGGMIRWAGWNIPCQRPNTWICPTFHPSYVLREDRNRAVKLLFEQHLKRAITHKDKPWKEVPDYRKEVEIIMDPDEAAKIIRKFTKKGGNVAFDYETNMLKPDSDDAQIITCSVCWEGKRTIAYPWHGKAIAATSDMLRSENVAKIASNAKFEERWTKAILKHGVKNWRWDTMLAAHVLDNRRTITSIKFQAFVLLGQEKYDNHIAPYLRSTTKSCNSPNRIKEVNLRELLMYNGLDSLLEYKVAMKQIPRIPKL